MKQPVIYFLTLLTLSTPVCFAATPFDDAVPTEVVNQVFGAMFGGQARLYADLPEGFPAFTLPQEMTVLVGVDQGWSQRVILKSRFDYQAAVALAYGALMDSGWQLVPRPGMQMPQTGFINPQQPVLQTQLCHGEHGNMEVSVQQALEATYVNLTRNVMQPGVPVPGCEAALAGATPEPQLAPQVQQQMQLQELMPRLVMPSTSDMTSSMGGYGGGGGSLNEWEVRTVLNGDWDLGRVFEHFADQLAEQGWQRDARVIGDVMASGSWMKTVDADIELLGSLTVLVTGDNNYDLRFRLLRKGAAQFGVPAIGIRGIRAFQ